MHDYRPILRIDHPDLQKTPCSVRADKHRQALVQSLDLYRVVECVQDVLVIDPVPVSALGNVGLTGHLNKLPCFIR
jgi:hypothetical protein